MLLADCSLTGAAQRGPPNAHRACVSLCQVIDLDVIRSLHCSGKAWERRIARKLVLRAYMHRRGGARRQSVRNGGCAAQRLLFTAAAGPATGPGVADSRAGCGLLRQLRIHSQARGAWTRQVIPEARLLRSARC